jgi:sulfite reductase alpha subunit-like flavoprotein
VLTGSAAILAKLRQQRTSTSANASSGLKSTSSSMSKRDGSQPKVTVLYASQTGTGQEIARSIHAECADKGLPSQVMSMNELGFDNLTAQKTPIVVVVASSTGKQAQRKHTLAALLPAGPTVILTWSLHAMQCQSHGYHDGHTRVSLLDCRQDLVAQQLLINFQISKQQSHRYCCFPSFPEGDGDPPDNSATAYVALKKSWPADRLAGVKFSVLGLGDSNYTRYMYVPRIIKNR